MIQEHQETQNSTANLQQQGLWGESTRTLSMQQNFNMPSAQKLKQTFRENSTNSNVMKNLAEAVKRSYHISTYTKIIELGDDCIFGDHLTIIDIKNMFGYDFLLAIIMPIISKIMSNANMSNAMDDIQVRSLCYTFMTDEVFRTLKITELFMFTNWFTAQHDEETKFYGTVSPLVITRSLGKFVGLRNQKIAQRESEQAMEQATENRKGGMSFKQWLELRGKKASDTNIGRFMSQNKVANPDNPLINGGRSI